MSETTGTILDRFGERYGPYAFGLLSLLLIWFIIVRPELEGNRVNFTRQEALVEQMRVIMIEQVKTADTLERTAEVLDKAISKLSQ